MLAAQGDLAGALTSYHSGLAVADRLAEADKGNPAPQSERRRFAARIAAVAHRLLLTQDFAAALDAAGQASEHDPALRQLQVKRAHALMLLGRTEEARALYLRFRGEANVADDRSWSATVRADFADLRQAGLSVPLMSEIDATFASDT